MSSDSFHNTEVKYLFTISIYLGKARIFSFPVSKYMVILLKIASQKGRQLFAFPVYGENFS